MGSKGHFSLRRPRLILQRGDGRTYLTRWGFSTRWGGVFVHRMDAPDPGVDLHDHPWPFVSLILRGGYTELRWKASTASLRAAWAWSHASTHFSSGLARDLYEAIKRGLPYRYTRGSVNWMPKSQAHRIVYAQPATLTLMIHGPRRRDRRDRRADWGFYTIDGWVDETSYDEITTDRDLYADFTGARP